ncbi:MAG: hypothetical protein AABZ53_13600 [Planctomycetota bacterium]
MMVRSVVVSCLVGLAGGALGDIQILASGGVINKGDFGRHLLPGPPVGAIAIYAGAEDNYGAPTSMHTSATGNYAGARGLTTPLAAVAGAQFTPDAQATIDWGWAPAPGSWYWDSTGSFAHLHVTGPAPTTPPQEIARSYAISRDPNTVAGFWGVGETDMLTFSTTFKAGLMLDTGGSPGGAASISGDLYCDAFGGELWRYGWSMGSDGMSFDFASVPGLGLNDGAIESQLMAAMISTGTGMMLGYDVTVSATIMIAADENGMISVTSGGGTDYYAYGEALVPTPGTVGLLGIGGVLALRRRR